MNKKQHDLVVIGAGPGGYVAAIRAAQLGLDTACVEMESALGGTCLRIGCIPSKALLESSERYRETGNGLKAHGVNVGEITLDLSTMMKRKTKIVGALTKGIDGLFKKNKVTRYAGTARITEPGRVQVDGKDAVEISATHIIIATGSVSAPLPGVELDGDRVGTSTEALAYPEVPESLVVIGAGAIGLELGSVWARLGTQVTVLEYLDHILPGMDREISAETLKILKKQGIEFRLGTRVLSARSLGTTCEVTAEGMEPLTCDRVLLAVGRRPNTEGLGLDATDIVVDKMGRIEVNDHFETNRKGVYAIGDVIRGPMLAHKAEDEGIACVEHIVTGYGHVNYDAIPSVVYTHPEVAAVGKTEEQLNEAGTPFRKGVFPFVANGRARALGETDGRVKILSDERTDRILGIHIVGPRAGDLIAEAVIAIEFGASSEDIARSSHAHPTLAEVIKEAAFDTDNRTIHI